MLNRIVFLYSFSIASIIVVSFIVGFAMAHLDGLYGYLTMMAFAAFIWYVIPAPKWMIPFLKVMQTAKFTRSVTREQLQSAIKAGMAEINGNS